MKVINVKLNIVFAISLALIPVIMSLMDILGLYLALPYYVIFWGIVYGACLLIGVLQYSLKGGKFDFTKLKNPFVIIVLAMALWIIISSVVNAVFNLNLIAYFTYFLIFICVYMLDSRWRKALLNTLMVVVAISCIMGFIDPYAKFMPGFNADSIYMSLHFGNPNYISHIVGALTILCFIQFDKAKTKLWNTFYCVIYLIYATHLFVNGSFAAITFLIAIEIVVQIILNVKTKKFRYKMLILSLVLVPICLLVELIPNIEIIRTCEYNYLLECVAVFDDIFGTNLLSVFGIDKIAGADGWNRHELLKLSWDRATSSPKAFIFGGGAGLFYQYRPHQGLLSLMLDFGVVAPILFITFFTILIVRIVKTKVKLSKLKFLPSIICMLLCYLLGSILPNSFYVFMILFSLLYCDIFNREDI